MRGTKPHLVVNNDTIGKSPSVPAWLSRDAKAEWRRIMPILIERRILTTGDLGSVENYCTAIGQVREMERMIQAGGPVFMTDKGPRKHPAVAIQADAMTRARLLAAELGLTPVSRSRPAIREAGDDDDLSDLDL